MYKPFDQFQKAFLTAFLEYVGSVESERQVPSQIQSIDLDFSPDERARSETRLGLLGRMAAHGPCMIECFSRPPGSTAIEACIRKQLVLHQEHLLAARRNRDTRAPEEPLAKRRLWIVSPGRPRAALHELEARPMQGWPAGFWETRKRDHLHVVVLRELPATADTLLLRCLGRGDTFRLALREFGTLPQDAFESSVGLPLLLAFKDRIAQDPKEDRLMQFLQELRDRYARMEQEAVDRGRQKGWDQGRRDMLQELLIERFGPLPNDVTLRIQAAERQELDEWSKRILTAQSLADVLH